MGFGLLATQKQSSLVKINYIQQAEGMLILVHSNLTVFEEETALPLEVYCYLVTEKGQDLKCSTRRTQDGTCL